MDTSTADHRVVAVVALKSLRAAKSRMSTLAPPVRSRLARVMALDTLAALGPAVSELVVVSDQPDLPAALRRHRITARVVAEPVVAVGRGEDSLNVALAHGAAAVIAEAPAPVTVLSCVGDLPGLRTSSVTQVLAAARGFSRSFLPDHDGRGTTMLIARGMPLDPRYGTDVCGGRVRGSADRHESSGAVRLSLGELPDARWDVDTVDDLRVAHRLGVGQATSTIIDPGSGEPGDYLPVTLLSSDQETLTVGVHQTQTRTQTVPVTAYDGDPAHLVPGRRLHAVRVAGALRCWL